MRVVHCVDYAPTLAVGNVAQPDLVPGCIRVQTDSCGIGMHDLLMMTGKYQVTPGLPFIPGCEIAGVVTEVSPDVANIAIGERIASLNYTFTGGLAEEIVVPAELAVVVPRSVQLNVAASVLLNYTTAYYALHDRGGVRAGDVVLVLGAGGGIGRAAIEIGKAAGASVIAAASTASKLEVARRHGADEVVNYSTENLSTAVKALGGVDLVVDPVGGPFSEAALRALHAGGRFLVVGFAAGQIPNIPLNLPLLKGCSIVGVFLYWQTRQAPQQFVTNANKVFELLSKGKLCPLIEYFDCFSDYNSALVHLADRERLSKAVMSVRNHNACQTI